MVLRYSFLGLGQRPKTEIDRSHFKEDNLKIFFQISKFKKSSVWNNSNSWFGMVLNPEFSKHSENNGTNLNSCSKCMVIERPLIQPLSKYSQLRAELKAELVGWASAFSLCGGRKQQLRELLLTVVFYGQNQNINQAKIEF